MEAAWVECEGSRAEVMHSKISNHSYLSLNFDYAVYQGRAFVKDFDKRSRNLNELTNERSFSFSFSLRMGSRPVCV